MKKPDKDQKRALVDDAEEALSQMLREVMGKSKVRDPGEPVVYSLTDKMKVMDRVLKLVAVKAKFTDDDSGTGFKDDGDEE